MDDLVPGTGLTSSLLRLLSRNEFFQKTVIEEVKANEAMGVKNAVAGDAKYDSPGRGAIKIKTLKLLALSPTWDH